MLKGFQLELDVSQVLVILTDFLNSFFMDWNLLSSQVSLKVGLYTTPSGNRGLKSNTNQYLFNIGHWNNGIAIK